ncbi:MAG: hypothetical protein QM784_00540 [Polyangiaceae bacterium]
MLEVQTPPGAVVVHDENAVGWASLAMENVMGWTPEEADLCNQSDIAGIFVLDSVIGNSDRHSDNVLVADPDDNPKRVYSIDVANAWLGDPEGFLGHGLDLQEVIPGNFLRGASRGLVESHARPFLERCRVLSTEGGRLERLVSETHSWTGLVDEEERSMLAQALRARLAECDALLFGLLDRTLGRSS